MAGSRDARDVTAERWFEDLFGVDTRSLALFRVGVGACIAAKFAGHMLEARTFYSDAGVVPREAARELMQDGQWSLHLLSGEPWLEMLIGAVGLVAALAFTVGARTRVAGLVALLALISVHSRDVLVLNGGDVLLRVMLLWALFLPTEARASIDALTHPPVRPVPDRVVSVASLAIVLQLMAMYFFTGLLKTGPQWHAEASAIQLALDPAVGYGRPIGAWLGQYPEALALMTRGVWWLEVVGPALAFVPVITGPARLLTVALFVGLHLGLLATLTLGAFPVICIACWAVVLPSWFWERLAARRPLPSLARLSPPRWSGAPVRLGLPRAAHALVAVMLLVMLAWNLGTIVRSRDHIPGPVQVAARAIGLDQAWRMFAPAPHLLDYWWLFAGEVAGQSPVDVYHDGQPLSFAQPPRVGTNYHDLRWRKLLSNLPHDGRDANVGQLARYLCAESGVDRVDVFVLREAPPAGERPEPLLTQACGPAP